MKRPQYCIRNRSIWKKTGNGYRSIILGYDAHNRVDTLVQELDEQKIRTTYLYGDPEQQELPGKPYGLKVDGTRRQTLTYDKLLRKTQEAIHLPGNDPENNTRYHSYEYGTNVNAVRTDMLLTYMTNDTDSYGYTYDNAGNISSITLNGTHVISYTYDELNQLIRENNAVLNKTITYTYDLGGNMTSRKEYAYTTGTLGTPTKTDTFTYGNTDWKDRLTAYNGVGITYDGSGNPLSYRGMTLSWQKGRQLASVVKNGVTTSFTYDSQGHRIRKTSGSSVNNQTVTRYFYNGESLTGLVKGNQTVQFVYDTEGRPFLMRVYEADNAGTTNLFTNYYYLYNGQGDVTGLIDSSNSDIVQYTYDSWGKMVSATDTTSASISTLNPFRYRGYIYDPETELYYLGSRYYDAEVCRFINADDITYLNIDKIISDNHLFCYCCNNPVNMYDNSGNWPDWASKLVAAAAIVAVVATAAAITLATAGAGTGVAAVMVGAAKGAAIGLVSGGISGGICGYIKTRTIDGALNGMANGALAGAISGTITGGVKGYINYSRAVKYLNNNGGNPKEVLPSFKSTPKVKTVKIDTTVYRVWGGKTHELGHWVSPNHYGSAARSLLALPPENTMINTTSFVIRKGTTILAGKAASLFGHRGGGI